VRGEPPYLMGGTATFSLLADAITQVENFVDVFISVYSLVLLLYIVSSWLRLPYSPWVNRIQRFLYDVSEPYLRIFRRVLPSMGPLDLSPMIGLIVLIVLDRLIVGILEQFH
jgi:YggT family protein